MEMNEEVPEILQIRLYMSSEMIGTRLDGAKEDLSINIANGFLEHHTFGAPSDFELKCMKYMGNLDFVISMKTQKDKLVYQS